ncbi:hypothetical protein SEA_PARTRIDGE_44 [Rhodococcus phage Partridge]|uniref:Uncharacterized protein n=1 Tax=Rhodococcus phage Partridge TaxID=1897441 RepID=A0A1I9S7W0_9CAUD|nr:hypothetical protein SEA_PARTRIDGE_44 [Rhodococcus phage Partridge]
MNDAINPDVYQGFSNGAQMIDITENLNGNGAQAVQYIGRSTRLDGVVKGDPIEDLTKAKWFVERELARQLAEREAVDSLETRMSTLSNLADADEYTVFLDTDGDYAIRVDDEHYMLRGDFDPEALLEKVENEHYLCFAGPGYGPFHYDREATTKLQVARRARGVARA